MRRAATWVARVLGVAKGPQADGKGQCHLPCCLSSACAGSTSRGRRLASRPGPADVAPGLVAAAAAGAAAAGGPQPACLGRKHDRGREQRQVVY